jgi:hypothetical protein
VPEVTLAAEAAGLGLAGLLVLKAGASEHACCAMQVSTTITTRHPSMSAERYTRRGYSAMAVDAPRSNFADRDIVTEWDSTVESVSAPQTSCATLERTTVEESPPTGSWRTVSSTRASSGRG